MLFLGFWACFTTRSALRQTARAAALTTSPAVIGGGEYSHFPIDEKGVKGLQATRLALDRDGAKSAGATVPEESLQATRLAHDRDGAKSDRRRYRAWLYDSTDQKYGG